MKTLEVNRSNEWLQVFSAVNFDGIEEAHQDQAADTFTDDLVARLEDAGFEVTMATGQRATCHGWNGANIFRHHIGPVGTLDDLNDLEVATIDGAIAVAAEKMRADWAD